MASEDLNWSAIESILVMASAASSLRASNGNDRFNAEAAAWDSNPFVHAMSDKAYQALCTNVPQLNNSEHGLDVLEIGCGTGLLSFLVAKKAREVVAVDAAQGMIDVLAQKIAKAGSKNIVPVCVLLEDPEDAALPPGDLADSRGPRRKYDLVISHLVLHHIPDLKPVLQTMLGCLKPGGMIALTDFEDFGPEARRFHPKRKMAGVERHGVNAKTFTELMREVGFVEIDVKVAWQHEKRVERWEGEFDEPGRDSEKGEMMNFSYLLCMGRRPS